MQRGSQKISRKEQRRRRRSFQFLFTFAVIMLIIGGTMASYFLSIQEKPVRFGATFSSVYAEELGLDWREAYQAILMDLDVKKVRIPVYWSEIESEQDKYNFSDVDWMMDEAEKQGVEVTLAIGQKVPRWPECFIPDWLVGVQEDVYQQELFDMIGQTVERYKRHEALEAWQLENEVGFPFGECESARFEYVEDEFGLVRALDATHPIQMTSSGEQSIWFLENREADILGVSLYRMTKQKWIGAFSFPHTVGNYYVQKILAEMSGRKVVISELQMEPWGIIEAIHQEREEELVSELTPDDMEKYIDFAQRTGIEEISFWGVEWWYYRLMQGDETLWQEAKKIINRYGETETL